MRVMQNYFEILLIELESAYGHKVEYVSSIETEGNKRYFPRPKRKLASPLATMSV